ILTALATFLGSIHSQNSLLDQALIQMGTNSTIDQDLDMLNLSQELGRELFVENCMSCHGKSIFESADILFTSANNGLEEDYLDKGIGAITFDENDNGKFKIPSLRNIKMTAPYMHDGCFETLQEVIEFYNSGIQAHLNLNEELKDVDGNPKQFNFTEEEKIALIDFLETMTDETLLIDSKYSDPFK
ncbi:MAG: cytochrome-c peroxidase, partial [Saprospiraceae bacterium]